MHRTTIPLEGPVERQLRSLAAHEKRSFKELINELIKRGLKSYRAETAKKIELKWQTATGKPVPSFDPSHRSTYLESLSRKVL